MQVYKGVSAAIVTAADEAFADRLLDLCDSLGRWRRYLHVVDLGLAAVTRGQLARRGIDIIDIADGFFDQARLERAYYRAMYLRPSLPDFVAADLILWIDSDCWIQRRSAIPAYFDAALSFPDQIALCTMLDVDYARCIDDYWSYQESYREQFVVMFGQTEADRLFGNAIFSSGIFAARRSASIWVSWRTVVSDLYQSERLQNNLTLGHMAEQNALNYVLHRDRHYHVLNSELNWHCHCSDVYRENGLIRIRPSGRIPGVVHLSHLKDARTVERYHKLRLFYERQSSWKQWLSPLLSARG